MPKMVKPGFVIMSSGDWQALTVEQQEATIRLFSSGRGKTITEAQTGAIVSAAGTSTEVKESSVTGIRDWNESVAGISAVRLRNCIIFQLDVRKAEFYVNNMSRGFVRRNAQRLNDDTPEDYVYDPDPLFGTKTVPGEGGNSITIATVVRSPKNEKERLAIRNKFGVNFKTMPFLVKSDCLRCKGTGKYKVSSYPNDPVYGLLSETVECSCSYE